MTVGDFIVRSAHKFPEKPAVISEEASLSYRDLNERVNRLAGYLLGMGLPVPRRVVALPPGTPVEESWKINLTSAQWHEGAYQARLYVAGQEGSTRTCEFSLP